MQHEKKDHKRSPANENMQELSKKINRPSLSPKKVDKFLGSSNETKALSIPEDVDDLPSSPEDVKESIKQKFLVEMPDDFYSFWSFCKSLSSEEPEGVVKQNVY